MLNATEKFLKTLSDKNRLRILNLLQHRKMCVCELAFVLDVTQPSISRHLKRLKDARLVEDEQDGFWTNYFLKEDFETGKDIVRCVRALLKSDKTIQADLKRLKKADRTQLCCK